MQALISVLVTTRGAYPNPVYGLPGLLKMLCTYVQTIHVHCRHASRIIVFVSERTCLLQYCD
jgi:hypothetical protein